jgi:UDP-glucuronate 4-epimerase
MAHPYSHLYGLMTTGLRFFTVYGPWGRPDMALFKFTKSIINDKKIDVYNYGNHTRDFTYIEDVIEAILKVVYREKNINEKWKSLEPDPSSSSAPWEVFNIGNNNPIKLMDYINYLEKALNKKAKINFLPLQAGDVPDTNASNEKLYKYFKFKPKTLPQDGIKKFVEWYLNFYK